jgi:hypothetical protein
MFARNPYYCRALLPPIFMPATLQGIENIEDTELSEGMDQAEQPEMADDAVSEEQLADLEAAMEQARKDLEAWAEAATEELEEEEEVGV